MLIVGLTGGIGSGKSTVASMLAEHGAVVIDVDAVGRDVIAPGGRAEGGVIAEFGPGIVDAVGHIDRPSLARAVFGRPQALARLTAISHPAINAELGARLDVLPGSTVVILDMAILVESTLGHLADGRSYSHVIAVEAPVDVRVERAVARGMREEDVRARIASQATDEERRAVADVVLDNGDDLAHLRTIVDDLWDRVQRWDQAGK